MNLKQLLYNILKKIGFRIRNNSWYLDMESDQDFMAIYNMVRPYTMTSQESLNTIYHSIKYLVENNIEGDIVECGVWRGGSSMASALSLIKNNDTNREIYLYDTFEGMSNPTDVDKSIKGETGNDTWDNKYICFADENDVRNNMGLTNYPNDKLNYIKGKVEDTIPNILPEKISLLRLDTDWFESTYHELKFLFPKLAKGGVLIIDDYGHWEGAKKAVDQYFKENNIPIFLNRIDYTVRAAIK